LRLEVEEVEDWRRTHYSSEITKNLQGEDVTVMGWVSGVRAQGGITFILLNDLKGTVQVTVKESEAPGDVLRKSSQLKTHYVVAVKGRVKAMEKAPHGAEIVPAQLKILASAQRQPPFNLHGTKLPSINKRLDLRAVDLRRDKSQELLRLRQVALTAMREFFSSHSYVEVHTPKIIASATEGGAALFPLLFYNREAFLTQSPQLYKEQLVMSLEKVYEIGPAFRAEQSRTLHHLSEFTSVDVEEAYVDYDHSMTTLEELTRIVIQAVNEELHDFGEVKWQFVKPPEEMPRITYQEALQRLKKGGVELEYGEDISTPALQVLSKELRGFYFIKDWPTVSKPFYIKDKRGSKVCESFDFMFGSMELASGGSRVSIKKELERKLKVKGLKKNSFEYHLKVFDYGMPPHAGFGLGLERFLTVLSGESNVRELALFPRDQFRLMP
jgi:aspartyl-tRNA synthetase